MTTEKPKHKCADCETELYHWQPERCGECQKVKSEAVQALGRVSIAKNAADEAEARIRAAEANKKLFGLVVKNHWRNIALIWLAGWVTVGGIYSLYVRYDQGQKGCVYRSLASLMNPGFVLGCELFRERWEIGK